MKRQGPGVRGSRGRHADMRRAGRQVIVAAAAMTFFATTACRATVSHDIERLPWRRPVEIPREATPGRWIEISEDEALARSAALDFADVRLMNDAGETVPSARIAPELWDERRIPWLTLPLRWTGGDPGGGEMVIDLGLEHPTRLTIEVPQGPGEGPAWALASDDLQIRDTQPERFDAVPIPPDRGRGAGITSMDLETSRRYVHLMRPWKRLPSLATDSVRVCRREVLPSPRQAVPFRVTHAAFRGRAWTAVVELDGPARSIAVIATEVRQTTPASLVVRVEGRLPRGGWSLIEGQREMNWSTSRRDSLEFEPFRTAAVRLSVEGADPPNPPFEIVAVGVVPFRWALPSSPSGSLWLAYGDAFQEQRNWNMEPAARRQPVRLPARLGPQEPNPFYHPPGFGLEWLRRHPPVVGAAMVAVLLLVALLVMRQRPVPTD